MFEFAWPWIFALLPLPWLMRLVLPAADSGEPALKVSYLSDLEGLARRRARVNLPGWRQQAPFVVLWLLLLTAAARPEWLGEPLPIAASGRRWRCCPTTCYSGCCSERRYQRRPGRSCHTARTHGQRPTDAGIPERTRRASSRSIAVSAWAQITSTLEIGRASCRERV